MRKGFEKLTIYLLAALTAFFAAPVLADAQPNGVGAENTEEGIELSVLSANVAGLPAFLSKYDRVVPDAQKTLGEMLNESGFDILCVQEDFQYHDILSAQIDRYPYQTYTSGGVPIGDGLNIFSKFPLYNVERVAWRAYNGIFTDGMDALTPKGFLKCTVDVNGVLIDLYNLHVDAYRTEADQLAKKAQLVQLTEYIEETSKGRPILVTGDTNLTFHTDPLADTYRILIAEGGFGDCWVELKNGGNYMQGEDASSIISSWYAKFGGHDWGRWDSVERMLYKNGDGLAFRPLHFAYTVYSDDAGDVKALTDHRMMECILKLDISEYEKPADAVLKTEKQPNVFYRIAHGIGMLVRCLALLLLGASRCLILVTKDSAFMKALLLLSTVCIVYGIAGLFGVQIVPPKYRGHGWTGSYIRCQGAKWCMLGLPLLAVYLILTLFFSGASIQVGALVLIVLVSALPSRIAAILWKKKYKALLAAEAQRLQLTE